MELSCTIIDANPVYVSMLKTFMELVPCVHYDSDFPDIIQAVAYFKHKGKVDIIFCDIQTADINAIQESTFLHEYCNFLVYISKYRTHGPEAFEFNASGYLLKPFKLDKFSMLISRLSALEHRRVWSNSARRTILVKGKDKNSCHAIDCQKIICVEGMNNYIRFHTSDGDITTYMQLKDLNNTLLMDPGYMRISRSTIIALKYLDHVKGYTVYMETGQVFTIGKNYRALFKEFLLTVRVN